MAVKGGAVHQAVLEEISESFDPTVVAEWAAMISAWQADPNGMPDPFQETAVGMFTGL